MSRTLRECFHDEVRTLPWWFAPAFFIGVGILLIANTNGEDVSTWVSMLITGENMTLHTHNLIRGVAGSLSLVFGGGFLAHRLPN